MSQLKELKQLAQAKKLNEFIGIGQLDDKFLISHKDIFTGWIGYNEAEKIIQGL